MLYQKGHKPEAPFKKGNIPWNKGMSGVFTQKPSSKKAIREWAMKNKIWERLTCRDPWNKGLRGVQRAEKSPNWKGGRTKLSQTIRQQIDFINIIARRKEIDNFTCSICGKRGGDLETDHYPKSFAEILEKNNITSLEEAIDCDELFNIDNLRTLCRGCHRLTKTYGRSYSSLEKYVNN